MKEKDKMKKGKKQKEKEKITKINERNKEKRKNEKRKGKRRERETFLNVLLPDQKFLVKFKALVTNFILPTHSINYFQNLS